MKRVPLTIFTVFCLLTLVRSACECGYRLRDTGSYFTHTLSSNFSLYKASEPVVSLDTAPLASNFSRDWTVQSWTRANNSAGPITRQALDANVWIQQGNLVLRQEGYTPQNENINQSVGVAALASKENNFLHGSFRSVLKVDGAQGGSVGGWFFYADDANEIDVEILTKEPNQTMVHYTCQPAISNSGVVIPNASVPVPLSEPWTKYQEYRFDWTRPNVIFYQNSVATHTTIINVPQVAGSLQFILWSDGGQWSGPPSTSNVTMNVQSILMYYNTTESDQGDDQAFNKLCSAAGGISEGTVCLDSDPVIKEKVGSASKNGMTVTVPVAVIMLSFIGLFWAL